MKTSFSVIVLALGLLGSTVHAAPSEQELSANYQACLSSDPSWYNRWGAYLVSFNRNEAYRICRSVYQNADIKMMGCRVDGEWLKAGYYCYFEQ